MTLLENPGETVTREELVKRIWPSDTFVEFEHGLNAAVNRLRQVLGDSVEQPLYIETVARRGYCFIGQVVSETCVDSSDTVVRLGDRHSKGQTATRTLAAELSLVVLPFADLGPRIETNHFADGLAEEVINALTKVPNLRVIARGSACMFRDRSLSLREIADILNVRLVLDGTFRISRSYVRVTAQLVRAADQTCLWSERYDRELTDLFELQEDIAQAILCTLKLQGTHRHLVRHYTRDQEAHLFYLKGAFYAHRWTPDANERICAYMRRVIEIEPQHAPAWVEIAHASFAQVMTGVRPSEVMPTAVDAAHTAVLAESDLAEAHAVLGLLEGVYQHNWSSALSRFKTARELNPAVPSVRYWHALILTALGETRAAISELEDAAKADPFSVLVNMHLCRLYSIAGDFDRAISYGKRAVEVDPYHFPGLGRLGEAYVCAGENEKGIALLEQSRVLAPCEGWYTATLAGAYRGAGRLAEANKMMPEVEQNSRHKYIPAAVTAFLSAALGNLDRAFDNFERAVKDRDGILLFIQSERCLEEIRRDPRYVSLLESMNLSRSPR
jgi:TolB-like protein/Flp pilus assembly protein TadD